MRPSLLPFTPWARAADYVEIIDWIERESLIDHVDAVQLSIRLLVPPGSPIASLEAMRPHLGPLEPETFSYRWTHPDPRMDRLQERVATIARAATVAGEDPHRTFGRIRDAVYEAVDQVPPTPFPPARTASAPPRLTEPWFC